MMPGKGTPKRSIRANDELWEAVKAKAQQQGRDAGDVTRQLWTEWLEREDNQEDK